MDTKSIEKLNQLHPKIRESAISAYTEACNETPANVHPYIVETLRTFEESDHLYELGRTIVNPDGKSATKPFGNIVTKAKGGSSWHNFAMALDFGLIINGHESYDVDENWMIVVKIFEKYGFTSGLYFPKDFVDAPHLENKCGLTIKEALNLYTEKKFIEGTEYIEI